MFKQEKWLNDVALFKMSEAVPIDPDHISKIQAVQLLEQGNMDFPPEGAECVFKGWGCRAGGRSYNR